MPIINNSEIRTLTAGGGTIDLPTNSLTALYIIQGNATLTSNWTIQPQGTATAGMEYVFRYEADIDLDGNSITVFGETMPETLADKTHEITASYDGTDWEVNFKLDVAEDGSVPLSVLQSNPFRTLPATSEVMFDGVDSPTIFNAVQSEGETASDLQYRVDATNGFIEFIGEIVVYNIDETTVSGDLSVTIMNDANHILSTFRGLKWRIPVTLGYHSSITDVEPVSIKGGVITKSSTFSNVNLQIPSADLGTGTDAQYRGYVTFKIPY